MFYNISQIIYLIFELLMVLYVEILNAAIDSDLTAVYKNLLQSIINFIILSWSFCSKFEPDGKQRPVLNNDSETPFVKLK